jgi:hypothetical protein
MGFADLAGTAKHQGYVMKIAQVRAPVYSLQPVETDKKAITPVGYQELKQHPY